MSDRIYVKLHTGDPGHPSAAEFGFADGGRVLEKVDFTPGRVTATHATIYDPTWRRRWWHPFARLVGRPQSPIIKCLNLNDTTDEDGKWVIQL